MTPGRWTSFLIPMTALWVATPLPAQERWAAKSPPQPAPSRTASQLAPTSPVTPADGDFLVHNFRFNSVEVLPELKLHYATLGASARDAQGRVTNAVLILHGTGGSGRQFLSPQFAGVLPNML